MDKDMLWTPLILFNFQPQSRFRGYLLAGGLRT